MIARVSSVYPTHNRTKGSSVYVKRDLKITALPPELTLDKPRSETWTELLSPWLIVTGVVVLVALLNGLIGG